MNEELAFKKIAGCTKRGKFKVNFHIRRVDVSGSII
jgi:hypothetical protein